MWKVPLFKLNYDEREIKAVLDVLDTGWLTMGEKTREFETKFAKYLGGSETQCLAVTNGTAALHLALLALGVGPGDEVIVPALTFVADINAVMMTGAKPVLADCESIYDWNVSASTIKKCITDRTKAVIVVHYAGFPCNMPEIMSVCRGAGIKVVEDVAHAPGASFGGKSCGTWGHVGCFSFFSNKNLSVGEGGMVASCDQALIERIKYLRSHGMTTLTLDRHQGRAITYDVVMTGLNYRIDEIRAALGIVQLDKLEWSNERRKELVDLYREHLSDLNVTLPFCTMKAEAKASYHIMPVLLPSDVDRARVIERLKELGVQSSIHYPPFWSFSRYSSMYDAEMTPIAREICTHEITLPLYPTMKESDVEYVATALRQCL